VWNVVWLLVEKFADASREVFGNPGDTWHAWK
jgi:hypothetical protein